MATARKSPPAPVKRALRQEAGFGCCVCGLPVYQYHHITPWHKEEHFRVEDMMLLCPLDHDAATKGALTEEEQRRRKAQPYNLEAGLAEGQLAINQTYLAIAVGGVLLVGDGPLIAIDDEPLLATTVDEDGVLQLSVSLYDEVDTLLAEISDNEWISGDPLPWDIESDHQKLTIRSGHYKPALRLNATSEPIRIRGKLWKRGARFDLTHRGIEISSNTVKNAGIADLGVVGAGLNIKTAGGEVTIDAFDETGRFVSDPDPVRRLIKARQALDQIRSEATS
jgi:HNH endonuclease